MQLRCNDLLRLYILSQVVLFFSSLLISKWHTPGDEVYCAGFSVFFYAFVDVPGRFRDPDQSICLISVFRVFEVDHLGYFNQAGRGCHINSVLVTSGVYAYPDNINYPE